MRRISPPDSLVTSASLGGQRRASIAISILASMSHASAASIFSWSVVISSISSSVYSSPSFIEIALNWSTIIFSGHLAAMFSNTVLVGSSCGSCGEVAHLEAVHGLGLAEELLVLARHDLQQGRLARAVDADDADLGVGQEVQPDVLEHLLAAGIGLGQAVEVVNVVSGGHLNSCGGEGPVLRRLNAPLSAGDQVARFTCGMTFSLRRQGSRQSARTMETCRYRKAGTGPQEGPNRTKPQGALSAPHRRRHTPGWCSSSWPSSTSSTSSTGS